MGYLNPLGTNDVVTKTKINCEHNSLHMMFEHIEYTPAISKSNQLKPCLVVKFTINVFPLESSWPYFMINWWNGFKSSIASNNDSFCVINSWWLSSLKHIYFIIVTMGK